MYKSCCLASLFAAGAIVCGASAAADETFSGAGGLLVDHDGTNEGVAAFTINVSGFDTNIVALDSVTLTNLNHTFLGDLAITVISPLGDFVTVTSPPAAVAANLNGSYTFRVDDEPPFQYETLDEATDTLGNSDVVASGTFAASDWGSGGLGPRLGWEELEGVGLDGDWTVAIYDFFPGDTGSLGGWSFTVSIPEPASASLAGLGALALLRRRRA